MTTIKFFFKFYFLKHFISKFGKASVLIPPCLSGLKLQLLITLLLASIPPTDSLPHLAHRIYAANLDESFPFSFL